MSDFVSKEVLPDLWEEILQAHWTFLETEESIQKIEERKKLEASLKEFLCIVPHDRKFFLPETAHVLKKSITEMKDFSAYKAMIGFESISQYANNLFTKPWRKEYRIIKMYSGFYQHEIKSNLVDANKLFKAMGYKQLSNQILMLDGPICPDQVTNVSRDALAAYVECQIMKDISTGLKSVDLSCSWLDIYNFRKAHIGDTTQGVKLLACFLHERKNKKDKIQIENFLNVQSSQPMSTNCSSCSYDCHLENQKQITNNCNNIYHHAITSNPTQQKYPSNAYSLYSQPKICSQQNKALASVNYYNKYHTYHHTPLPIPHSNSLDHHVDHNYMDSSSSVGPQHHQYILDQLNYDTNLLNYDYVDGSGDRGYQQNYNLIDYNHPSAYSIPNNRYHHPVAYNLPGQLNNELQNNGGTNNSGNCINMINNYSVTSSLTLPPLLPRTYNTIGSGGDCKVGNGNNNNHKMCNHMVVMDDKNMISCRHQYNPNNYVSYKNKNSNKFNTNFDERIINNCTQDQQQQYQQLRTPYNSGVTYNNRLDKVGNQQQNLLYFDFRPALKDLSNHEKVDSYTYTESDDADDDNYLYSTVGVSDENKSTLKQSGDNKYNYNPEVLKQYQKMLENIHKKSENGTAMHHRNYEEIPIIDDDVQLKSMTNGNSVNIHPNQQQRASKAINKNQDGVGSFESWDYVFQNLEKQGYNKEIDEKNDLLVQGLDLDSLNVNGVVDKRRSRNVEKKSQSTATNVSNDEILLNSLTLQDKQNSHSSKRNSNNLLLSSSSNNKQNLENSSMKTTIKSSSVGQNINSSSSVQQKQQQLMQDPKLIVTISSNLTNNNYNNEQVLQNALNKLSSNGILIDNHCKQHSTDTENISSSNSSSLSLWPPKSTSSNNIITISSLLPTAASQISSTSTTTTKIQDSSGTKILTTPSSATTILCGPNEWSCHFCTYLNSDTRRICEMCCRSKDFILDTTNTPTCV